MKVFCPSVSCRKEIDPKHWKYCPFCGHILVRALEEYNNVETTLNRLASMGIIKAKQIDNILRDF